MSALLVVTGPPGSGKSTVARTIADRLARSVLVEGDAFFGFLASGAVAPWLPESNDQNEIVTRAAAAATARFVLGGYDTVFDGIVGPWFLPTFGAAAALPELDYVILLPTVETCVRRVADRSGHDFDDEPATRKMHEEFSRAATGHAVLADDGASPGEVADRVEALWSAGRLRWARDA